MAEWVAPAPEPVGRRTDRWGASAQRCVDRTIWRECGDPLLRAETIGPLTGTDLAVKDLFRVSGHRLGAGVPAYLAGSAPADHHADAVSALLGGGAALRGITHSDEFGYSLVGRNSHYGTPPNVAVPGAVPGGSSSGTAAAVGLGLADIGLGTDTAGSVRVPASYQGLWGLRTTHGRVSTAGMLPLAPAFDTAGLLTRTADTLRAAAATLLGSPGPAGTAGRDLQLVVDVDGLCAVGDPVRALFRAGLQRLAATDLGSVDQVHLGDPARRAECFRVVQGAEAWRVHGGWLAEHPGALGADVAERFATASAIDADTERAARVRLAELRSRIDDELSGRVLVMPTTPSPAPALTSNPAELDAVRRATLELTSIAGVGGYPAVSVPRLVLTTLHASAPVGLSLVGPRGSDLALIDLGQRLDLALT